jgi:lambda repressor-like predicted transcriptional regulator
MKQLWIEAETFAVARQQVRATRKNEGINAQVSRLNSMSGYAEQEQKWSLDRRFAAAMYIMGGSLRQISMQLGCSVQAVQNRLGKEIPRAVMERLAASRLRIGAPLLQPWKFTQLADAFYGNVDEMMAVTLEEAVDRLMDVDLQRDGGGGESVSRICGRADDSTGDATRERSSGESTGATQAERGTEDRSSEG